MDNTDENARIERQAKIERRIRILNIVLIILQASLILISFVFIIGCALSYEKSKVQFWTPIRSMFILSLSIFFLVVYITTLIILNARLKMHFPDFYMKQKSRIITLHACIILAIIGRMIMSEI